MPGQAQRVPAEKSSELESIRISAINMKTESVLNILLNKLGVDNITLQQNSMILINMTMNNHY